MRGKGRLKSMGGDLGRTDCSNRFNANSQLVSCAREGRGVIQSSAQKFFGHRLFPPLSHVTFNRKKDFQP